MIYLSYVLCYKVTKPVSTSQPNISALQVDTCHCLDCSVKEKRECIYLYCFALLIRFLNDVIEAIKIVVF